MDPDELTTTQTDLLRAFVTERGGGLLVLGARGLQGPALRGTALEAVLPLDPGDRASGIVTASNVSPSLNRVTLTAAGEAHPVMQIGDSPEETRKRWAAVPSLASVAPLGAARPGSAVLAVTAGPGGVPRALVAVQRTGQGRAMVFTGEASWRWRMMLPASDRSYDRFWRQAVRWLGQHAPSAVSVTVPASAAPGDVPIDVFARDGGFLPRSDAVVDVEVRTPAGDSRSLRAELSSAQPGHYVATLHAGERGIYRLTATAARGAVGAASASMLIGSADPEFTDPRVDAGALARIARASGGAVVTAAELPGLVDRLRSSQPATALRERHDLWSEPWSFAVMAVLLPTEWLTRRRWGLR